MEARLPSFVVAGAPRCGTTSLHYYLRQHPQVCMSDIKEPNAFLFAADGTPFIEEAPIIRKSVPDLTSYRALFRPGPATLATGDASPLYLYTEPTPARILEVCGSLKVVCVLRRPAERAWSHFLHAFADVPEDRRAERFAELVGAEMREGTGYTPYRTRTHLVRLGRYAAQLRRYHAAFGPENVLTLLTEELASEPARVVRAVAAHIGVDPAHELDVNQRYNTTGGGSPTGWGLARRALRRVQPAMKVILPPRLVGRLAEVRASRLDAGLGPGAPIDPNVAERIARWCADDVAELEELIGRDLNDWQDRPGG